MFIVVAYDIPDDKKRNKIAKILEGFGIRVQYSVFECNISYKQFLILKDKIQRIINPSEDRVYFYSLCPRCRRRIIKLGQTGTYDIDSEVIII